MGNKNAARLVNLNPGRNFLGVNDLMGGRQLGGHFCSLLRSQAAVLVQHYQPNDCLDDLSLVEMAREVAISFLGSPGWLKLTHEPHDDGRKIALVVWSWWPFFRNFAKLIALQRNGFWCKLRWWWDFVFLSLVELSWLICVFSGMMVDILDSSCCQGVCVKPSEFNMYIMSIYMLLLYPAGGGVRDSLSVALVPGAIVKSYWILWIVFMRNAPSLT